MNEQKNKIPFKEKLEKTIQLQKKQMFALAIEFSLGLVISVLLLIGAFVQIGQIQNIRNIFKYVSVSIIAVGLLTTLLAIRFYKNDNIVEVQHKVIFAQKFLAYVFFVLLIVAVSMYLLSSKQYGEADTNLEANRGLLNSLRWTTFTSALLMTLITLPLLILNSVLAVKNDTKVSYQTLLAEELARHEAEFNEGELQTEVSNETTAVETPQEEKFEDKEQ